MGPADRAGLERFTEMYDRAEVYFAYDLIHKSVHSPFRTTHPDTLFNASRFLLMRCLPPREVPLGVSVVNIVYVLAKQVGARGGPRGGPGVKRAWCAHVRLSRDTDLM
jgi:intraflagellar transport protein 122